MPSLAGVRKSISKIRILVLKKYNIDKTLSMYFSGNIFGKNITIYTLHAYFVQSNNEILFSLARNKKTTVPASPRASTQNVKICIDNICHSM
jgi:hypothetical protein